MCACGPISIESIGCSYYFVTFNDDYLKYTTVYMIKYKNEILEKFNEFVYLMENLTENCVKAIRSVNVWDYASKELVAFCESM